MSFHPEVLSLPRIKRNDPNGAVESAQFVCKVLSINHSGIRDKRFYLFQSWILIV